MDTATTFPSTAASNTKSKWLKSGPLPNKLQEEAVCLHEEYLTNLESLATQYQVDLRCLKQYLALEVALHWKPNQYNVFLHTRAVNDPPKEDGM